jgi:outer membrane lipoprotein-sorting protein
MNTTTRLVLASISTFALGFTISAFAADLDTMMKKADTAKGHVESIKKEGGEAKQNVKDLKTQETMKNASQMKDDGKKLKDVVTGK